MVLQLAHAYATLGKRVLVIDADGDGDLGRMLQVPPPATSFTVGFCDALFSRIDPYLLVESTRLPNVSLLGPGDHLCQIDDAFMDRLDEMPEAARRVINALRPQFDVLLIDTTAERSAPATFLAMAAADVVLPLAPQGNYGRQPAPEEVQDLQMIRQDVNPDLRLADPVIVEPGPAGQGVSPRSLAQALCRLGRFINRN
jgi:cellulose biosynthesis protein BcsQ